MFSNAGKILACALFVLSPIASHSALHDRGGGLVYDDVLDVTWLQDANYARTSGFDADGRMSWSQSTEWVEQLSIFDSVRNTVLDDWRLPTVAPVDGVDFKYEWDWTGATDEGYNIVSPNSEMSYMYYVNLGLDGWYLPSGVKQSTPFGVLGTTSAVWQGQADIGLFRNIQSYIYWSNTEGAAYSDRGGWIFATAEGNQRDGFPHPDSAFVWAVRDGDVAPVPEPGSWAMLLLGLTFICARSRPGRL